MATSSRTPAAKPETSSEADVKQAAADGKNNETSNDPNLRAQTTEPTLTEGGRIATNQGQLEADRPGFHCGYCGQPVGPEGQHWDAKGEATGNPHAGTLVVSDQWPEAQVDVQAEAAKADDEDDTKDDETK